MTDEPEPPPPLPPGWEDTPIGGRLLQEMLEGRLKPTTTDPPQEQAPPPGWPEELPPEEPSPND